MFRILSRSMDAHKYCKDQLRNLFFGGRKKCNSTMNGDRQVFYLCEKPLWMRVFSLHKISSKKSQRNFSVNHGNHITSDAHVGDSVVFSRRANVEATRPALFSIPCSIMPSSFEASTPCFTAHAVQHPAAEPVAGSSPL